MFTLHICLFPFSVETDSKWFSVWCSRRKYLCYLDG